MGRYTKFVLSKNTLYRTLRPFVRFLTDSRRVREIAKQVYSRFPFLESDFERSLVIDLGANRGDFTMWAASQNAHVIAVEPDPIAFAYLAKRTKDVSGIYLLNCAVSNESKLGSLYHHINRSADPLGHTISSSIDMTKKNVDSNKFSQILILDIENLLIFPNIKLLKIDIEGGEKYIWKSIALNYKNIEYLLIEVHDSIGRAIKLEIQTFIESQGLSEKWKLDWI
jgi:FkbM family methyltransferase